MEEKMKFSTFVIGLIITLAILTFYTAFPFSAFFYASQVLSTTGAVIVVPLVTIAVVYRLITITTQRVLHLSMEEIGIPQPKVDRKWLIIGLLLPLTILVIYLLMPGQLSVANNNQARLISLLGCIFVEGFLPGILEEMIFRGLLMHLVAKRFGMTVAVVVPSVLFAALHLVNGALDAASMLMLFIGGTAVGIMFSLITLVKNSIWNSAVVHGLWDFFIIGIFNFTAKPDLFNLYSYHVASQNILISGGAFGIEPSLICTIAYLLVAYVAYLEIRKNKI